MNKYWDKLSYGGLYFRKILNHPVFVWSFILCVLLTMHLKFNVGVQEPLFVITALTAGWIVAFHTTYWSQKRKFINDLKFNAAKSLVQISADASHALVMLDSTMRSLTSTFNLRKGSTGEYFAEWGDIRSQIERHFQDYSNFHISMLGAYEMNEILFLDLRKLINIFNVQHSKISGAYYKVHNTLHVLILSHVKVPTEDKHTEKIRKEAHELSEICLDTIGYIYDLRIELLNRTIGPMVHERVPDRVPQDPKVMILSEIAKKDKSFE